MTVHERLEELGACKPAKRWARQYSTYQEVWDNCDRVDWLFWWSAKEYQVMGVAEAVRQIADSVKQYINPAAAGNVVLMWLLRCAIMLWLLAADYAGCCC